MQIFFIDESGTIPPKNKSSAINYFTLGGVIIPEDLWYEINKELVFLKNQFNVNGEIKWRHFCVQKSVEKSNSLSHLVAAQKEELRLELYKLITKFKSVRLICAIVDVKKAYCLEYVQSENDLYWVAYKQIIERFQYHLQDITRTIGSKINGIIVCDHRQPKDDYQLRLLHQKMLNSSKKYFSLYQNLIEGVFIAPSHFSVGIQFADMIAGAVYRSFVREDERYFNLIKDSFRKGANGRIEGYGLVRWPK